MDYSSDDNFYFEDEEDGSEIEIELQTCGNCGRNFNVDVLSRHYNICTKVKQRETFDSRKQRLAEIEKIPVTTQAQRKNILKPKKKDWRWEHEQFIRNIRAARGTSKGDPAADPSPPAINPDYVQCPHCQRRFNESAAKRHIEFCKEQKSRIPKQSDAKYALKKEKQDKRATYKPPLPGQKKTSTGSTLTKARNDTAPSKKRTKSKRDQPSNNLLAELETKSDTTVPRLRKRSSQEIENGERLDNMFNSRYSKTHSANSRTSSGRSLSEYNRTDRNSTSGKTKEDEPKWFKDLKRNNSGPKLRRNLKDDLESEDSGMDLNGDYTQTNNTKSIKDSPIGVVKPYSRLNEKDISMEKPERTSSSGRRKNVNFCHDCGTQYPLQNAKFCCECGVRRMILT